MNPRKPEDRTKEGGAARPALPVSEGGSIVNDFSYTMQIRCGCEGGGKGPLVATELSATLSCANVQTLFQPTNDGHAVRRLTPVEYERLQGFPDNWTRVSWNGKSEEECPATRRYKAAGNSIPVPVMSWIGRRIIQAEEGRQ